MRPIKPRSKPWSPKLLSPTSMPEAGRRTRFPHGSGRSSRIPTATFWAVSCNAGKAKHSLHVPSSQRLRGLWPMPSTPSSAWKAVKWHLHRCNNPEGVDMADFARFLEELTVKLSALAEQQWTAYRDAAISDGTAFVDHIKVDLERWSQLLANGSLTKEDFAWLVQGKKDLATLEELEQEGLALERLDQFRTALVDL